MSRLATKGLSGHVEGGEIASRGLAGETLQNFPQPGVGYGILNSFALLGSPELPGLSPLIGAGTPQLVSLTLSIAGTSKANVPTSAGKFLVRS